MAENGTILAIGGLSPETAPTLFASVVAQAPEPRPRVGFLPTASADSEDSIRRFYKTFDTLACEPAHLELFGRVRDPAAFIGAQDVILVGGGNTKSMLGLWREWGVDGLLREAWQAGTLLAGFSAGAICWFEEAFCDAWENDFRSIPGLGFLPGSACPHYDREPVRGPSYIRQVEAGSLRPGIAIDDHCAVRFEGTTATRVFATHPDARAYTVREGQGAGPLAVPHEVLNGRG